MLVLTLQELETLLAASRPLDRPGAENLRTVSMENVLDLAYARECSPRLIEAAALDERLVPTRYVRNLQAVSLGEQAKLLRSRVTLVGLGGLGGILLDMLLRLGVGVITAVDGESFEETNLNRQLLSSLETLHSSKTEAAMAHREKVNPSVELEVHSAMVHGQGFAPLVADRNLVIDALGGLMDRTGLQQAAAGAGVTLISGAVAGWTGWIAAIRPGDPGPASFMGRDDTAEHLLGAPVPLVNMVASVMAGAVTSFLTTGDSPLAGRMCIVNGSELSTQIVELESDSMGS